MGLFLSVFKQFWGDFKNSIVHKKMYLSQITVGKYVARFFSDTSQPKSCTLAKWLLYVYIPSFPRNKFHDLLVPEPNATYISYIY